MKTSDEIADQLGIPRDFHQWTEGMWLAVERIVAEEEEDKLIPECLVCHTKPSESNGFEERFCKCGKVHVVTKRVGRRDENQAAKEFKKSQ